MRYTVLDSETCGFVGPMVLLQTKQITDINELKEIKNVNLHHVWEVPIVDTLKHIEDVVNTYVIGFNLVYDWFHLTKIYNLLRAMAGKQDANKVPDVELAIKVEATNPSEFCLRPVGALDLMLYAQRGPYQAAMKRKDIYIRKVPLCISGIVAEELKANIPMKELYFYNAPYKWEVVNEKDGFADIRLRFHGSTKLDAIAHDRLKKRKGDWVIPSEICPTEIDYIPFGQHGNRPWGTVIRDHIMMWHIEKANYYAHQDVVVTGELAYAFNQDELNEKGTPLIGTTDDDSFLACMIGATRVRGFSLDKSSIPKVKEQLIQDAKSAPKAPRAALAYLHAAASDSEKFLIKSTDKKTLQSIGKWTKSSSDNSEHEVARRAKAIFKARQSAKRVELLNKIESLPSFHPVFKIIGTKSSRLSGGSDDSSKSESLNPHGIPRGKTFREIFTFAFDNERCNGGDADSFEITIMAADFNDPVLNEELKSGKKFHALIWADLFDLKYEELLNPTNEKLYDRSKTGSFSWAYGGTNAKVAESVGVSEEKVTITLDKVNKKYQGIKHARDRIYNDFCSMRQPKGIGTAVIWSEPKDYCESLLGFRRYFTLENYVCKSLFNLANKPSGPIRDICKKNGEIRVKRRDKEQSVLGALQSALYACAFNIQAGNLRQAGNHRIQSTGGQITKGNQRALYEFQPVGIHKFVIRVINIHDELITVDNGTVDTKIVMEQQINKYRKYVPLLKWGWKPLRNWADTKGK